MLLSGRFESELRRHIPSSHVAGSKRMEDRKKRKRRGVRKKNGLRLFEFHVEPRTRRLPTLSALSRVPSYHETHGRPVVSVPFLKSLVKEKDNSLC